MMAYLYCKDDLTDTRVLSIPRPGCQAARHPGVGMHNTRVSVTLSLHSFITLFTLER